MITTLDVTHHQPLHTTVVPEPVGSNARAVPEVRGHDRMPYALGVLLGLIVVLVLAVWAYLQLSNADYASVVDLTRSLAR